MEEKNVDKYQCLKLPLQKILYKDCSMSDFLDKINDVVMRTNYITIKSYMILRLWILNKYHNNLEIPIITEEIIGISMKSIIKKNLIKKDSNKLLLNEFKQLHSFSLEDGLHLSQILKYNAITMLIAIENNIKNNFISYINRFVNSFFNNLYKEQIDKNKEFKKQLSKELQSLKNDIINNTLNCDKKYHKWLNENRFKIVPEIYEKSYYYDLKVNPQKYLKYMIFMNIELEKIGGKMYQFFPLQTKIIPNHITIDTRTLIQLLIGKNLRNYENNLTLYKDYIWKEFFNIKNKFIPTNYEFDYTIMTDGYSTSIRFIHKDHVEEENLKKEKLKDAKEKMKNLTNEEKKIFKGKKDKQEKINKSKSKKNVEEFPYIDEVSKEQLEGNHIFIDPGKKSLLTMMDDNGNFLSYTNKQRITETKRLKYQSLLQNYKDKLEITIKETELTGYNSKSCDLIKFKEYIDKKLEINDELYPLYQETKFRQYKWYSYLNTKRAEDKMLNLIENKFGKDSIIIIGDWNVGKQMRNFISTPNISIKRVLKKRFPVFNIDEFRTSCLNYKTEERCKNLYLQTNNKKRKIHSILTYQMENTRKGCINRDKNGCKNIQKIFKRYMKNGNRPKKYRRDYKFE